MKHPSQMDLFAYAELLADKVSAVPVEMARHVARCSRCAAQVEEMRRSLRCVAKAGALEPSEEAMRQVLAAARQLRTQTHREAKPVFVVFRMGFTAAKVLAAAAVVLLMANISFRAILAERPTPRATVSVADFSDDRLPSDVVQQASHEIGELANVLAETPRSLSPAEQYKRRFAYAVREDLAAASLALERNPGCERALDMMTLNLTRQADVLKRIYLERTL